MQTCFHTVGLCERPIEEAIRIISDAGYDAIELNAETLPWAQPHVTPETDMAARRAIVDHCRSRSLPVAAVGAHVGMVMESAAERSASVDFVNGCTDLAVDVGAPYVHILSGEVDASTRRADAWRWWADTVGAVTDYAASRNVGLGIEAIAGHLFCKVDHYHQLCLDLPGTAFRINFDPSHLVVQDEDPRRVVDELGERVAHVHMKDGKGRFPEFEFPPLGSGVVDFQDLVNRLGRAGFAGALSIEYESQVYGYRLSEREIVESGMEFLNSLDIPGRGCAP